MLHGNINVTSDKMTVRFIMFSRCGICEIDACFLNPLFFSPPEFQVMEKFETVLRSQLVLEADEAVVLGSRTTDKGLHKGIRDCVAGTFCSALD